MTRPVAVLISDVHYSLSMLKLADAAMRMAIAKANELKVILIVAGDLHDTKANLRGECVNAMVEAFKTGEVPIYLIIGNHDKINEKSEEHSLNFLSPYATIVNKPIALSNGYGWGELHLIPYQHDTAALRIYLKTIPRSTIVMHQGIEGSDMGDYIQDKSALMTKDVAGMRVISGHYHTRQTIVLPNGGKWDYVGNPYTVSFGEANDPPKGFQILMDDGTLEFVPTNLRKHVIVDTRDDDTRDDDTNYVKLPMIREGDLLWVKIRGSKERLASFTKDNLRSFIPIDNFRLDLIPDETISQVSTTKDLTQSELMDSLVDSLTNTSEDRKVRLKAMWKSLAE